MKQTTVLAPVIDLKRGGSSDERPNTDTPPHAATGLMVGLTLYSCHVDFGMLWQVDCVYGSFLFHAPHRMQFLAASLLVTCWSRWQMSMTPCSPMTMKRWWSVTERNDSASENRSGRRRSKRGKSTAAFFFFSFQKRIVLLIWWWVELFCLQLLQRVTISLEKN